MPIPDFQSIMLPLLRVASDGREHSSRDAIDRLADVFRLSESERKEMLSSGQQATFDNRVGWARTYLSKAGLLQPTRRGHFRISERGIEVLNQSPPHINIKFLEQFAEFVEFKNKRNESEQIKVRSASAGDEQTPAEAMDLAYQRIRSELAAELLQQIMSCSPVFFERLVVDLLVRMGYGGTRKDAGQAIGRSGDGGIDGIIKEDRLGLDVVYIQAKRWEGNVGRPEIQKFVGALQGQRAKRGIFIATSAFTSEAIRYASMIENRVVLMDGQYLSQLMIDNGVGVSPVASYDVKRVDSDYFNEA